MSRWCRFRFTLKPARAIPPHARAQGLGRKDSRAAFESHALGSSAEAREAALVKVKSLFPQSIWGQIDQSPRQTFLTGEEVSLIGTVGLGIQWSQEKTAEAPIRQKVKTSALIIM